MEVVGNSGYDAIVVGSGPGGATVAKEMACGGKKDLILEWGPGGEVRGTAAQVLHLTGLFSFRNTARIMVKIKDELGGRLTDGGGVRKKLTAADHSKLKAGFENPKRILKAAGTTDIYKTGIFATHPGGTVQIGDLVDANLRTRIDKLYVCDCSVIPEAWGLPPTLTLVAVGKRLARHLLAEQRPVARPAAA